MALAALVAAPLWVTSVAGAQEMNLPSGVTQRVAPESDALGTKLGGFTLYPKLGISDGYDSNIYAQPDDKAKSDGVFVIDPSLAFESNWSRNKLALGGFFSQSLQTTYTQEDHADWGVGGSGQLDVLKASNIKSSLGYQRLTEPRGGINPDTLKENPNPIQYDLLQWGLVGNHRLNQLNLSAAVDFDMLEYQSQGQQYRDRDLWAFTGQGGYTFSPGYSGFVRGVFNKRDFENTRPLVINGVRQDSQGYNVAVGIASEITNLISGEAYIGYLDQDYESYENVSGVSFGVNLEWEATKLTTVRLTASRDVADSTAQGAGGILYSIGGFGIDHELMPEVLLKADFSYYNADYQGTDSQGFSRDDDGYRASVGVDYRLSRIVHLDLLYSFDDRDSNVKPQPESAGPPPTPEIFSQDYTRHQVTFGVRLQH
ncbi:MAG: outer membrane beta-barrel protein [bacterium]